MAAMRKDRENLSDMAVDAAMGYTIVVLAIACFLLGLIVLMAFVRLIVGLG